MQRILDAMTTSPAFVRNGRLDIVAANQLGYALYSVQVAPGRPANTARFTFLDPRAKDFYLDWDHVADELVAILRSEAGRDPYDRGLTGSSESSRRKARRSAPSGRRTTFASTTQASSACTTRWSATSSSPTSRWRSRPVTA